MRVPKTAAAVSLCLSVPSRATILRPPNSLSQGAPRPPPPSLAAETCRPLQSPAQLALVTAGCAELPRSPHAFR